MNYMDFSFRKQGLQYLKCLVFMIIYTFSSMLFPGILSIIIDKGVAVKDIRNICIYTSCFLFIGLMIVIFQYLVRISFFQFSQSLVFHVKNKVLTKLLQVNLDFWKNHSVGDMFTVIENDIPKLESLLTTLISDTVVNILILFGTLIILIRIDPLVSVSLFILASVSALLQKNIGRKVKSGMENIRKQVGNQAAFTNELLNYATSIQITNQAESAYLKYSAKNKDILGMEIRQNCRMALSRNIGMIYNVLSILMVIILGSVKVYHNDITVGLFFSMILYAQNLYSPVVGIGNTYVTIKSITPLIDKVLEVLSNECIVKGGLLSPNRALDGNINFDHVHYSYTYDNFYQINDLSFNIQKGKIMGIVGKNGCGKSTIVKLFSLLITPQQGHIKIDGLPISEYEVKYLRDHIGFMLQDIYLANGSINEILASDDDEKLQMLINDFEINKIGLEKGLETQIIDNSSNLSGGEKQKIAIAKLFLEEKSIYILDEPTSAMDLESEKRFCNVIRKYLEGKTAIIITHRPEILKICDEVLRL